MPAKGLEATSYAPFKRYLMEIAFAGTRYGGWQIQDNAVTVQGEIQKVLKNLYGGKFIHLIGSSRTDAGVHALGFAAAFLVPERPAIEKNYLMRALNRMLPKDICIRSIREVPLEFHARYDALGKAYTYVFNTALRSPFVPAGSWHIRRKMDRRKMMDAAQVLTGTHDYSSFVVERSEIDDAVRTIYRIEFDFFGPYWCATFVGNGFLYKMIRCLSGLLAAAGAGDLDAADAKRILEAHDRTVAPATAPAEGLYLMKVFYDQKELENYKLTKLPFTE